MFALSEDVLLREYDLNFTKQFDCDDINKLEDIFVKLQSWL